MHDTSYSAIIIAGGKSSRLSFTPKAGLSNNEQTLLERALEAAAGATARVVVGPDTLPVPDGVLLTREEPVYSGPAAAIHAGAEKLAAHCGADVPPWCLILGVDTPYIAPAVHTLHRCARTAPETINGFWGISGGVYQPLVGIYRYAPLREVFAVGSTNASVRSFLKRLHPETVELAPEHTADVDTWEQAAALGFNNPQWHTY